jgi:hypothetical protein
VKRVTSALIGIMFLFAGMSSADQVKTDYDRSANFSQYKTFSFEEVKMQNPLFVERIKNSVRTALARKGWTPVDSGSDISIVATGMTRTEQMHVSYDGITGGSGWTPGPGGIGDTDTYKVGTLVVDLFETKTKKLLWRGSSSDVLSRNSNKNIKNLDKSVEKMFKKFPSSSSKN